MALIETNNLSREFKLLNRHEGLRGAFMDLFSRDYRIVKAVNNVSLKIEEGEIVGLIGPNGAGKSTTIKMLTGVLEPTSGSILVNGSNPYRNRKKYMQNIGIVFGQRTQLWWEIPVIETFKLLKGVYKMDNKAYEENMSLFNEFLNLKAFYNTPGRNLSLGQRMLCDIAAAFLHNPKVIFLDEPTIGLDINIKMKVRKIIKNLNALKNTTIILTSHDTGDIEELAKRIILIDKGTAIFDGDIEKFNNIFGTYRTLKVNLDEAEEEPLENIRGIINSRFPGEEGILVESKENGWLDVTMNQEETALTDVLNYLLGRFRVRDIKIKEIALENVIQKVYDGGFI